MAIRICRSDICYSDTWPLKKMSCRYHCFCIRYVCMCACRKMVVLNFYSRYVAYTFLLHYRLKKCMDYELKELRTDLCVAPRTRCAVFVSTISDCLISRFDYGQQRSWHRNRREEGVWRRCTRRVRELVQMAQKKFHFVMYPPNGFYTAFTGARPLLRPV